MTIHIMTVQILTVKLLTRHHILLKPVSPNVLKSVDKLDPTSYYP